MNNADFIRYLLAGSPQSAGGFTKTASVGPDATAFQPQVQPMMQPQTANVPMPTQRPVQQQVQAAPQAAPQAPMSLAAPYPGAGMSFSGAKGPQWTDAQWQNYWNRSNPDGLMSYYPAES